MDQLEQVDSQPPVWVIFGDLMSGLVGVFVLLLIWVLGFQLELAKSLEDEIAKRETEQQRRQALEQALADPLAQGRIILENGKIGISGNFLFSLNSDQLQEEGKELLHTLVSPLLVYLSDRDQLLMISGFTDDLPIQKGNNRFQDNWELSAKRALTVTRALIELGMPADRVFAAAFGAEQPAVTNSDPENRAKNRRVELAPVPRGNSMAIDD